MPSSAVWEGVTNDALAQAAAWVQHFSPVLTAFVALGVLGLAVIVIRRATS